MTDPASDPGVWTTDWSDSGLEEGGGDLLGLGEQASIEKYAGHIRYIVWWCIFDFYRNCDLYFKRDCICQKCNGV